MSTDSLVVTEKEDGTFEIGWDPNDPRYSFLNDMSQEDLNAYFTQALEQYIKEIENESNNSGS